MRDFKNLEEIDLKLYLLSGGTIKVENLEIKPYTLEEIRDYGYSRYMENLQWISVSVDDFVSSALDLEKRVFLEQEKKNLKVFDFFIKLGGEELQDKLLDTLAMIFRTDDVRVMEGNVVALDFQKKGIFALDDNGELSINIEAFEALKEDEIKLIHRDNFDDIVKIVKLQNYLIKPVSKKSTESNPADDATKALLEHMEKMRKKVEDTKRKQRQADGEDEDIDIYDIIDSVSSKSNSINKFNIWKLTIYELYSEYSRLELIDNYDFSIRAMIAGAEKIDLKHWSSKL